MPRVYLVPGFLGTELWSDPELLTKIWLSYSEILLGRMGKMRLAIDGTSPGFPGGIPLYGGQPIPEFWGFPALQLNSQLGSDWTVTMWGFDWRKELYSSGQALANHINAHVSLSDPCSLVGHSTGGLVCRAAWHAAGVGGFQGKIRRIVTLGTPHQGTYLAAVAFSGAAPYIRDALVVNGLGQQMDWSQFVPDYFLGMTGDYLADLAASWPSLYELLPTSGSPDSASDPNRDILYNSTAWVGRPLVRQSWLDYARTTWAEWLLSPASMPPAWVLTTVAGIYSLTPARLVYPNLLGQDGSTGGGDDGDSVVTRSSAIVADSAVYTCAVSHNALVQYSTDQEMLAGWITDVRLAPSPAPPVQAISLQGSLNVGSVIGWGSTSANLTGAACLLGKCHC